MSKDLRRERIHLWGVVLIKMNGMNTKETIAHIGSVWKTFNPGLPFEFEFLDKEIDKLYRAEIKINTIVKSFAVLAIILSCLGLFGLASFLARQRTKEISIRKVLGASTAHVFILLGRSFTGCVMTAYFIACPIAFFILQDWLQNYANHINLGFWPFVFAGLITAFVAFSAVGYQATKTALANPVDSLRSE